MLEQFVSALPDPRPWRVILADDDKDVHAITSLALTEFTFEGRPLEILSAYSASETVDLLAQHPDAAVLFLDVVMESDHAGLDAIRRIREDLGLGNLRIVVRTGQAGRAPEREVIRRYDIHDYILKTDLRTTRLETVLFSCLRAYRDIVAIETSKKGLERIIDASAAIFQRQTLPSFAESALEHLTALMSREEDAERASGARHALAAVGKRADQLSIVAGSGRFAGSVGEPLFSVLSPDAALQVQERMERETAERVPDRYIGVFQGSIAPKVMIVEGERSADSLDDQLMRLFSRNIGIGLENLQMKEGLDEAQREIAYRLGGAVESRSKETANHIRRVAEMSALIGVSWGLSEQEAMILKYASPLHDVGKIGIPDHILNKPGKHTAEEWEIMKTHAHIGYELVYSPDLEILRIGGLIALEHHERWDGRGYPFGKAREEIGIHGRIVAAIDVFDALGSKRCYKNAWPLEHIVDVMRQERGAHFDPTVIDVILDRLDDLTAIREALPD
jgi:response regulator RpfG family c-di-GMP phosphodiesterase